MSRDVIYNNRSIYGVWDFLGDVGGLFDMLKHLTELMFALSSYLFGSNMNRYIYSALFKTKTNFKIE